MLKSLLALALHPLFIVKGALTPLIRALAYAEVRSVLRSVPASSIFLACPEFQGTRNIELGENLYCYPDLYIETQEAGHIRIGNDVVMSRGVHLVSHASIVLEDGVMIGEYSSIRDANHRRIPGKSYRHTGHVSKPIHIRRNAWIGRGVTILPGVTIGEGAIVGANAVVTHNVPDGVIACGIPARPMGSAKKNLAADPIESPSLATMA